MYNGGSYAQEAEVLQLENQNMQLAKLLNEEKRKQNDPKTKFERFQNNGLGGFKEHVQPNFEADHAHIQDQLNAHDVANHEAHWHEYEDKHAEVLEHNHELNHEPEAHWHHDLDHDDQHLKELAALTASGRHHDELTEAEKKLHGHDESETHEVHDADSDDENEIHDADSDDDDELKIVKFGNHNTEDSRRRRV